MKRIPAIKGFFERVDSISPDGGRKISMAELKELKTACTDAELHEFGRLCAEALGEPYEE